MTKVGVLGGGRVGSALASSWRAAGHDVRVSTRETLDETVAHGEVVVLALPAPAAGEIVASLDLAGKILVDATNNVSGGPDAAELAAAARGAHVVKAFNTVFATFLHDTPPTRPATLVMSGDDAGAKVTVAALARDLGFDAVDAGGAEATPLVEALAHLVIRIAYRQGRGPFVYRFEAA